MPGGDLVYRVVLWSVFLKDSQLPYSCSIDYFMTWEDCERYRANSNWGGFCSGIGLFPKNTNGPDKAVWFENAFYS